MIAKMGQEVNDVAQKVHRNRICRSGIWCGYRPLFQTPEEKSCSGHWKMMLHIVGASSLALQAIKRWSPVNPRIKNLEERKIMVVARRCDNLRKITNSCMTLGVNGNFWTWHSAFRQQLVRFLEKLMEEWSSLGLFSKTVGHQIKLGTDWFSTSINLPVNWIYQKIKPPWTANER